MPKKNKGKNRNSKNQQYENKSSDEDRLLQEELNDIVELIEDSAERVKTNIINDRLVKKISSLRAVNQKDNKVTNQNGMSLLEKIKSREVGGGMQTTCTACRRRLFGPN